MENNNDNKVLNVPHLRFPEFSGEWKKCKLGDLCNVLMCKRILVSQTNTEDGVPFYKIGTIGSTPDAYISKELFDDYKVKYNYPRKGEVMITCAGTVGKCVVYDGEDAKEEQQKISHLLSLLDERIATQNKIIEKLQSLIKGLAVALTTKEKANIAISQCLECHSSTLQESEVLSSGLCKVFGANGLVGYKDVPQMNGDAILVIKDGSGVGTVSYAQGKFSVIGTLNYLTVIGNNDLRYLYFALSVFNFQPYKTGMAIPHIYFKDYGKAKIYCPSLAEQKRVANALDKLESKLFVEQELLASFNQQKLYLLGKMFI